MANKTYTMDIDTIKDSDGWNEMAHELKWEQFQKDNPDVDEDELSDRFYNEVVSKMFEYGEYGSIRIVVDENFNIVGGKVFPNGK